MNNLKQHIKTKNFEKCYLFYGDEHFLINLYEKRIKDAIISPESEMMNYDYFEGNNVSVDNIINSAETLPFLADKRLVFVKNSGFFQSGKSQENENLINYLEVIPDSTCLIFSEENVDKRSKLFKAVSKNGYAVEFNTPQEKDFVAWVIKDLKNKNIKCSPTTAIYFIRAIGADMEAVSTELEKIAAYKNYEGELNNEDVDKVCIKSLETKIFDLVAAIGNKKPETAIMIFENLVMLKESPLMVLSMISRQFRLMLQCKVLSKNNLSNGDIAKKLGIRDFVVRECLSQGNNFSNETLEFAIEQCLLTDVGIKTGKFSQTNGVEMLIIQFAGI